MKRYFAVWALMLVVGFSAASVQAGKGPYTLVNTNELQELIKKHDNLVLIDSRGEKWFDGTVIKGAKNLSVVDTSAENLAKIVSAKDIPVVFYCSNVACKASELAAYKASAAGYTNLYKYPDGIDVWVKAGLPVDAK